MNLILREAGQTDAVSLSELAIETYSAAFGHSFTPSDLTVHLERHLSPTCFSTLLKSDTVLIAEVEGRCIGYVQFGAADTSQDGSQEVRKLYVHPDFQNKGVGKQLMEAALSHPSLQKAKEMYLDVWEHNKGAQRFYARYGFEVVGARPFYVASEAETSLDLIMVRSQTD